MGRRLLDKMERTAAIAKCEAITLKISTAAEDAIKFHIRHGYHVVNTIFPRYISHTNTGCPTKKVRLSSAAIQEKS